MGEAATDTGGAGEEEIVLSEAVELVDGAEEGGGTVAVDEGRVNRDEAAGEDGIDDVEEAAVEGGGAGEDTIVLSEAVELVDAVEEGRISVAVKERSASRDEAARDDEIVLAEAACVVDRDVVEAAVERIEVEGDSGVVEATAMDGGVEVGTEAPLENDGAEDGGKDVAEVAMVGDGDGVEVGVGNPVPISPGESVPDGWTQVNRLTQPVRRRGSKKGTERRATKKENGRMGLAEAEAETPVVSEVSPSGTAAVDDAELAEQLARALEISLREKHLTLHEQQAALLEDFARVDVNNSGRPCASNGASGSTGGFLAGPSSTNGRRGHAGAARPKAEPGTVVPDVDPALRLRSAKLTSIKSGEHVDGSWIQGKRRNRRVSS